MSVQSTLAEVASMERRLKPLGNLQTWYVLQGKSSDKDVNVEGQSMLASFNVSAARTFKISMRGGRHDLKKLGQSQHPITFLSTSSLKVAGKSAEPMLNSPEM
jgi:hypothetical protein